LEGIWWSSPFSDLGAFLLTGIWLWREIRQLNKTQDLVENNPQSLNFSLLLPF